MKPPRSFTKPNISIVVTLHSEGILAFKTLKNIAEMVKRANVAGISCETIIGLDFADEVTTKFALDSVNDHTEVYKFSLGDSGLHRNELIEKSRGEYILIHDGDDFFTQNFLVEAYERARKLSKNTILVPEVLVNFDAMHYMSKYIPSNSPKISKRFFFETNYYTSQYLASRELMLKVKYSPTDSGYGYEDWWINTMLVAEGAEFNIVPNTAFYYRRKKNGSLLARTNQETTLIRKTKLFEPHVFLELPPRKIKNTQPLQKKAPMIVRLRTSFHKHILTHRYLKTLWYIHHQSIRELNDRFLANRLFRKRLNAPATETSIQRIIEYNATQVPKRMALIGLRQQLIEEWGLLNQIEPLIRASWDMFEYIPIVEYPTDSGFSNAYYEFCKVFASKNIDDIIFVPHMIRGGAELATIHLTAALTSMGRKVMVVSSLDTVSVWSEKIREIKGAYFVENKDILLHVPDENMRLLFWARIIQYWDITRVTTINSEFGYKLLSIYRKQLKDMRVRGYVHTYAFDITEDGYLFNYIPNGLVDLYGAVSHYITDSQRYNDDIKKINGFDDKEVKTLYLPVNTSILHPKTSYTRKNKVIYAARICNQKIADVAVEVGKLLANDGIELHFYGNIDPEYAEGNKFLNLIENFPTIKYMGIFDGFGTLPIDDYDMFLLTTRTEGLANVIIEACVSNIYIVSAAVGGLPEVVINNRNGYLIPDTIEKFSSEAYYNVIMNAYRTNEFANVDAITAQSNIIRKRHSLAAYENNVRRIYDL